VSWVKNNKQRLCHEHPEKIGYAFCLVLLLTIFIGSVAPPSVFAALKTPDSILNPPPEQQAIKEQIKFTTKYPALSAPAGSSYEFEIEMVYTGGKGCAETH
jgi:hypothetical protein